MYSCWCACDVRPIVHKIRTSEHRTVYGAVEPLTGDFFYTIEHPKPKPVKSRGRPRNNKPAPPPKVKGEKSHSMNRFMQQISDAYPKDHIVILMDNAWWHRSQYTVVPSNITILFIPPYTPEMNPIEQIWRELRTRGFANKYFETIIEVETAIHTTIANLPRETIMSITQRDWIMQSLITKVS